MFSVGQVVRVVGVFAESFPEEYEVVNVITHPDGQVAFELVEAGRGEIGGFSAQYLEAVE